jgi:hypothetical protein
VSPGRPAPAPPAAPAARPVGALCACAAPLTPPAPPLAPPPAPPACPPRAPQDVPEFSIRGHFAPGSAALLTGASGYIGSLVLEKLLRATDVGRVYVLLRPRRGRAPAERLERLLQGPLFHRLRAPGGGLALRPDVAARVTAVEGDILQPGLGISDADRAELLAVVDTVVHSAAGAPGRAGGEGRGGGRAASGRTGAAARPAAA